MTLSPDQLPFLLATHKAMNLTQNRFKRLKAAFGGNWEAAWNASESELVTAKIDTRGRDKFRKNWSASLPTAIPTALAACGARALIHGESGYPSILSPYPNAPVVLFCRGELKESDEGGVAVVGSRKLSSYGKQAIETLVSPLAKAGVTIISGLAYGADAAAHQAALRARARTVAVLGSGIDVVYPKAHERLTKEILMDGNGCILSEYFPGESPRPEYFPVRNRIVSALSRAVLVIEATEKSGSLITARLAGEQGKDVFAVPGDIFSLNSGGTNRLIADGMAHPAITAERLMEALHVSKTAAQKPVQEAFPLTTDEQAVLDAFGVEPQKHINELIRDAGGVGAIVSASISMLELKGKLRHVGAQYYAKIG